jgi:transposase-like protein/ribosomal protein L37AE/L43A
MEDYPRTLAELEERFHTEEACREYLAQLRWPEGFRCPVCAHPKEWKTGRELWECAACGRQTSVTAGTIFERTRKPLALWFRAIWLVTSQKGGVSAKGVQRVLGFGSYETAWTWLHKLRRAMVRPGRERLSGLVEVDETLLGAPEKGVLGRETQRKAKLVVAAEAKGAHTGRVRMGRVTDFSAESLVGFVRKSVEPGSTVHTDGWQAYNGLCAAGYRHDVSRLGGRNEAATELLPRVHRVVSLLKRWLLGTLHGAISHEHLDYYLDEFTFRFNRRTSRSRGKLFYRLVQQAVAVDPAPYSALVQHARGPKPHDHNM